MLKAYKIEIKPSEEQIIKINKSLGICRFLYNEMIMTNEILYEQYKLGNSNVKFIDGYGFDKYVNNTLSKQFPWIKNCGAKARKKAIMNCDNAFKEFFKGKKGFPKYKKKVDCVGLYFPKNNLTDYTLERHRIKIPTLGFMRLKEFGYIPISSNIKSGVITKIADKYFMSVLVEEIEFHKSNTTFTEPIGIDLGLKDFAVVSDGRIFKNINKTKKVKKLEKSLKRQQRTLSRKLKNKKKMEVKTANNINKNILRVQKLHYKLSCIRRGYVENTVNSLVKNSPKFIAIEDLNVKGMMRNRCLSKAIQNQNFYYFRVFLISRCKKLGIEVRIIDRWYPSSKLCRKCGQIKSDLTLKDRVYNCDCGHTEDRDLQASINIKECEIYKVAN